MYDGESFSKKPTRKVRKDEAETIGRRILDGGKIRQVPENTSDLVIAYLQQKKEEAIAGGDYLLAQDIEDKTNEFQNAMLNLIYDETKQSNIEALEHKLRSAEGEHRATLDRNREARAEFNANRERAIEQLRATQEGELEHFNETHKPEEIPPKFRKFSSALLDMRVKEKSMIKSKMFPEAARMKKEADALEKKELEAQSKSWNDFIEAQRKSLLNEHKLQMESLLQEWDDDREVLLMGQSHEKTKSLRAVDAAKARIAIAQSGESPPSKRTLSPPENIQMRMRQLNYTHKREASHHRKVG